MEGVCLRRRGFLPFFVPGLFHLGFLRQQHTTYVRMYDNRIGRSVRVLRARQRAHLQAVPGISERVLKCPLGMGESLYAGAETGEVHESEHVIQALVDLADQVPGRAIEIQQAGRIAVNAHFVFQAAAADLVPVANGAIFVRDELGNDEQ